MRIKKKFLLGLFLLSFCSIGLFGLTSCKKDKEKSKDGQIQEVYQAYVANATKAGEQPLNYDDWLKSIKGADGKDGVNGLSAFEIYKKYHPEYNGTEQQWIDSLAGASGATGKSAYEIAKDHGYTGTETEWLQTLIGASGATGKSAYEIAKDHGYTGTETEWLQTLIGTTGATGKSAYEIAKDHGYTGTETEWLQTLVGTTGATGTGIQDIDVKVEFNKKGEQVTIFTFKLSDGSSIVKNVVTPKLVRQIYGFVETNFPMSEDETKRPTLKVNVEYSDGSSDEIKITEDMIVSGNVDFTQEGSYELVILIQNREYSGQITIYDPNRKDLENVSLVNTSSFLWLSSEVANQTVQLGQLQWYLEYSNNTHEIEPVTLDQINFSDIQGIGNFQVSVQREDVVDYLDVYVCEDQEYSNLELINRDLIKTSFVCEINQSIDFSSQEGYLREQYNINETTYMYYRLLTDNDLTGFDNTLGGSQEIDLINQLGHISVFVYESMENRTNVYINTNAIKVVTEGIPEFHLVVFYEAQYNFGESSYSIPGEQENVLLTSDMIEGTVDFTKTGVKEFSIIFEEKSYPISVEVYDPTICNISYLGVESYNYNLLLGQTEEDLKGVLIGQELHVDFFEPENDQYNTVVAITDEMLDLSQINFTQAGNYNFTISYRGRSLELDLDIEVDLSNEEVAHTLNYEGDTLVLYANGYAVLYETQYTYQLVYDNQAILIQDFSGHTILICGVDLEQGTFFEYDFSAKTPLHVYTCDLETDVLTVYLYEDNIGYGEQNGFVLTGSYLIENDQLTLYTLQGTMEFLIEGTTLTLQSEL